MELRYTKLTDAELTAAVADRRDWSVSDGMLTRLFEFKTYKEGLVFAGAVGWVADKLNHHPDILIGYGKVTVSTVTHDAGGLTSYDFELARRIDAL